MSTREVPANIRRFFAEQVKDTTLRSKQAKIENARTKTLATFGEVATRYVSTLVAAYRERRSAVGLADREIAELSRSLGTPERALLENARTGVDGALAASRPLASRKRRIAAPPLEEQGQNAT